MVEGPIEQLECVSAKEPCPFVGECVFMETWAEAAQAVAKVLDQTTIGALVKKHKAQYAGKGSRCKTGRQKKPALTVG